VLQENHSFDNYFGALAHAPASPYYEGNAARVAGDRQVRRWPDVHGYKPCVPLRTNSNLDDSGSTVVSLAVTSILRRAVILGRPVHHAAQSKGFTLSRGLAHDRSRQLRPVCFLFAFLFALLRLTNSPHAHLMV
jgi:hypothetical protein